MPSKEKPSYQIFFKWMSFAALLLTLTYWIFTLAMIFFPASTGRSMPAAKAFYQSFFYQDWKLFSTTLPYHRELKLVIRNDANPALTDTIPLVANLLTQKTTTAPFNNYADAMDRMLHREANRLEGLVYYHRTHNQSTPAAISPAQFDSLVMTDPGAQQSLHNLIRYGHYVAEQLPRTQADISYQLQMVLEPIAPPGDKRNPGTAATIIFTTSFKKW